jgi:uroporphyrinogen-III decarboxylase
MTSHKRLSLLFTLMAGCEVPPMAPPYNVYVMKKAADDFGWYDY